MVQQESGTAEDPENPENAGVTVGKDGNIIGGNGADTRDEAAGSASKGGDGGAGIEGDITPTVNGGSVTEAMVAKDQTLRQENRATAETAGQVSRPTTK